MFAQCGWFHQEPVRTQPQVLMRGDCAFKVRRRADDVLHSEWLRPDRQPRPDGRAHHAFLGAYFGELAMLTRQRTGTALVATDCILFT